MYKYKINDIVILKKISNLSTYTKFIKGQKIKILDLPAQDFQHILGIKYTIESLHTNTIGYCYKEDIKPTLKQMLLQL